MLRLPVEVVGARETCGRARVHGARDATTLQKGKCHVSEVRVTRVSRVREGQG